MNLIIDIGNTLAKLAVFQGEQIIQKEIISIEFLFEEVIKLDKEYPIQAAILSSVNHSDSKTEGLLEKKYPFFRLSSKTKVPFENLYRTPETLGVDRIALMAAAAFQFPRYSALVIDAGSCITLDFLNDQNQYFGGAISPGIEMRYKSVHQFTAKLPLLKPINTIPNQGDSTQNAIHLGVLGGVIQEIDGIIEGYRQKYPKLTVILTGGDINFLSKNLKSTIFAKPNFLLEGLNSILIHNLDE